MGNFTSIQIAENLHILNGLVYVLQGVNYILTWPKFWIRQM